jgi:hypothetical protein
MSAEDYEQKETGWGFLDDLPGDPMIWVLIFSRLPRSVSFWAHYCSPRRQPRRVRVERRCSIPALPD